METLLLVGLAIYFIPISVALMRKHRNTVGIAILNITLGWTFLGWVGALIWAVLSDQKSYVDGSSEGTTPSSDDDWMVSRIRPRAGHRVSSNGYVSRHGKE